MPELINSLKHTADLLVSVGEFLFFTVIVKYIVIRWIAEKISNLFKRYFLRTERAMAIWMHYRNQALDVGHKHDTPIDCDDGKCKIV